MSKYKWVLVGDTEDSRRLLEKVNGEIVSWKDIHVRDDISGDIAYGSLVGVNDLKRRFNIPGIWLDYSPMRCQVYYAYWKDQLFQKRQGYKFLPLSVVQDYVQCSRIATFVRPDSNNKCFTGGIYNEEEVGYLLNALPPETLCVVSTGRTMDIYDEYRCFMYKGKFITGSSYKLEEDGSISCKNVDDYTDLISYAEKNFPMYPGLPDLYALDIAIQKIYTGEKSLMELTSWSNAGLYDIDLDKYISTTEMALESKLKEILE